MIPYEVVERKSAMPNDSPPPGFQSNQEIKKAYDISAEAYSAKFLHELDHKPQDRELLRHFAENRRGKGTVLDLGCGPGHTTSFLGQHGAEVIGVDISEEMISVARQNFPALQFEANDFMSLKNADQSVAGMVAFYCLVHLADEQLPYVFKEWNRVLMDKGEVLISFHIGNEKLEAENFLETDAFLVFKFFELENIITALESGGFKLLEQTIREPYPTEYPSERAYLRVQKNSKQEK